jgi:hypothetical protein
MCVYVYQGLTVGWWQEERHSSDTTARSAGCESQAGWAASHGCCVLLYSCCVVQKKEKGEERAGMGSWGKYPGAPPHHIRKTEKNKPTVKRYLIGQVVKGKRLHKKKKKLIGKIYLLKIVENNTKQPRLDCLSFFLDFVSATPFPLTC